MRSRARESRKIIMKDYPNWPWMATQAWFMVPKMNHKNSFVKNVTQDYLLQRTRQKGKPGLNWRSQLSPNKGLSNPWRSSKETLFKSYSQSLHCDWSLWSHMVVCYHNLTLTSRPCNKFVDFITYSVVFSHWGSFNFGIHFVVFFYGEIFGQSRKIIWPFDDFLRHQSSGSEGPLKGFKYQKRHG